MQTEHNTTIPLCRTTVTQWHNPPICNMMPGAVCDGHRVDVGPLRQEVQWNHVSVMHVIRIDDVYMTPDAELAGVVDGAGTRWMDCCVYGDVTPTLGGFPAAFTMQDKLLSVPLAMRILSDTQKAAIPAVSGTESAHIQSAKDARCELQAYMTADPQRWQSKATWQTPCPHKPTSSRTSK